METSRAIIPHGDTPSSPATLSPVNVEAWKTTVSPSLKNYFTEEYQKLQREYEQFIEKYELNKFVYESDINFEPIVGKIYHLYRSSFGKRFLSVIEPVYTHWEHLGSFRLNTHYVWEVV